MPHSDTDSDTSDDFSQLWPAIVTIVPAVMDGSTQLDASRSFRSLPDSEATAEASQLGTRNVHASRLRQSEPQPWKSPKRTRSWRGTRALGELSKSAEFRDSAAVFCPPPINSRPLEVISKQIESSAIISQQAASPPGTSPTFGLLRELDGAYLVPHDPALPASGVHVVEACFQGRDSPHLDGDDSSPSPAAHAVLPFGTRSDVNYQDTDVLREIREEPVWRQPPSTWRRRMLVAGKGIARQPAQQTAEIPSISIAEVAVGIGSDLLASCSTPQNQHSEEELLKDVGLSRNDIGKAICERVDLCLSQGDLVSAASVAKKEVRWLHKKQRPGGVLDCWSRAKLI